MITVAVIGIVAVLLAVQVKAMKPEYGIYVSLAVCLVLFSAIGVTYIAELASDLCKDAGYQAVAGQIELFGKLALLSLSMPVVLALLETVNGFL